MRSFALLLGALLLGACGPETVVDDVFFVRSGGADMPVWVRGEPAARTVVVYIAGGPGGPGLFAADAPAYQRLTERYLVAFWDQRASGGSTGDASPESLTLAQYADDLDAVVTVVEELYDRPRIVLLGHSWGGLVGISYLSDPARQARIRAWVFVDGAHNLPKALSLSRDWARQQAEARIDAGSDVERWREELDWYRSRPVLGCSDMSRHSSNLYREEPERGRTSSGLGSAWLNLSTPFDGMATLARLSAMAGQLANDESPLCQALMSDLSAKLPGITLPILTIWGRFDRTLPLEMGEEAHALYGAPAEQKRLVVLEDSGHDCPNDEPEAFASAIEAFLDEVLQE
ncbi:MAG: alpha/beta fold hydrolase [Myxococcales bacterium]|jgi:proline iminopeptidase